MSVTLPEGDGPRILFFDIETAPTKAWVWRAYDTNIIDVDQDWYSLSFAYAWGDGPIEFVSIRDVAFKPWTTNDRNVAKDMWALFDAADIVVAHNGKRFDVRKMNARFIHWGFSPPAPYAIIDTAIVARRYFDNLQNSLKALGKLHSLDLKMENSGFALWLGCMAGDDWAWEEMEEYNRQDIVVLRQLYHKLRPWILNHPNMNFWNPERGSCPNCGGTHVTKNGFSRTMVSEFQRWKCQECGATPRSRLREKQHDGGVQLV